MNLSILFGDDCACSKVPDVSLAKVSLLLFCASITFAGTQYYPKSIGQHCEIQLGSRLGLAKCEININ